MITRSEMGKLYQDGEAITTEGEIGDCMFVVQQGEVQVTIRSGYKDIPLSVLGPGDVFGEMALFTKRGRSATVRALGQARVMTVDKRGFVKRIHEDPSLAFRILSKLSERIHTLDDEIARLRGEAAARAEAS